jgi:hypothetical protein
MKQSDSMQFNNITNYRAQAEECFRQSELTSDTAAKLHWLTLSEAWLLLADSMTEHHADKSDGESLHRQFMPRPATLH